MRNKSVTSVFLRHVAGAHETASNSGVATLRNFHRPQARENACWGAPQTRWTSGQIVPKSRRKRLLDAAWANAPGPYFPARPYGRADNQCLP